MGARYPNELQRLSHMIDSGIVSPKWLPGNMAQRATMWHGIRVNLKDKWLLFSWSINTSRVWIPLSSPHWGINKITNISQTTFLNAFAWMKFFLFSFKFRWRLLLKTPTDNKSALVKAMVCRPIGTKPLPEPVKTHFTYKCFRASLS